MICAPVKGRIIMSMQLEIRHLRLIRTIVEEGSMAKAIHVLHLSPSALSHQLREAEQQVGARIFNRVNKKMLLTGIGEKILLSARSILDEMDVIEQEVKQIIKGESGTIRVCTECYTNYYWLPSVLKKFQATFPDIRVKVNFETSDVLVHKLLQGDIDLMITSDPVDNKVIEYLELFEDEMVALVSADHPWARKKTVTATDFRDQQLIIFTEPLERVTVYKRILQPEGIAPRSITVLPNTETAVELVRANMGVMVVAQWTLRPYLGNGLLKTIRVTPSGLFSKQYAAVLRNDQRPAYYDYFIRFLKEEIEL